MTISQGKCTSTSPAIVVENGQTPIISSDNGSNICVSNINLSVKNLTGIGITHQWQKDGKNILRATNSSISISESGNYIVSSTQNNCKANSAPFTISNIGNTVSTKPLTGKYLLVLGTSNTIQAVTSSNLNYSFQWFRDGIIIPNATQSSLITKQGGKYTVRATLGKCSSLSGVVEFIAISSSRTISFEEDEQTFETEELKLSPNPTSENLKIQYFTKEKKNSESSFEIINTLGMSILSDKLDIISDQISNKEINVKDLTIGMYFVRIIDGEKILVKRFIKVN